MEFENNENYKTILSFFNRQNCDSRYYELFFTNDYPIPYKDLYIYPVKVELYLLFHMLVACLVQSQKTVGDAKAISMSYLDYLVYLASEKNQEVLLWQLCELLPICLKLKPKEYKNGVPIYDIKIFPNGNKWNLQIDGVIYDSKDFDKIREIICEQNAVELPDEETNPDIVKIWQDVQDYKLRQSQLKICSFEDQINVLVAKTSYLRHEVLDMTIRSFSRLMSRVDKIMYYEIYTLLKPNMSEKDQKQIPHYLQKDKDREEKYQEAFVDEDMVKKKFS